MGRVSDDYGSALRAARHRRGLTQRSLAERSGVHQPTIAAIETGRRQPTGPVRQALDDAVRIRPSEALDLHREQVRAAVLRYHGTDAMVVGSTARGVDGVDSDLDLMVTFEPGSTDVVDLMDLIEELQEITGVRVDIMSGRTTGRVVEHARRSALPL